MEIFHETIVDIGPEETRLDEEDRPWLVTVGFPRSPKAGATAAQSLAGMISCNPDLPHIYRVVTLHNADGSFIAITDTAIEG